MSTTVAPAGGAFLLEETDPATVFTPEEFGPEARLMGKTAEAFLCKEVLPHVERIEAHDLDLMRDLMRKAGELGLLGAEVPEIYGGLGLDHRTGALIAEKLNWQQSFALTHEAHTVIATLPLLYFGNHTQKQKYLPKLASGEWIGSFCLSEPGSGSDALGAQTRATLSPDRRYYLLRGTKMWITNAAFADLFTVFAKVDGEKFTPFLVERSFPGLSFGKEERKLGMWGTSTRRVILEDVPVPVENVIGEIGKGHYAAFCALNQGRFKLEAGTVGGLKETIAACATYARQRKQFGRPIAEFGLIQAKLGEMVAGTFALESAVYRLAGLLDGVFEGIRPDAEDAPARYHRAAEEYAIECAIVKVVGSELYSWATDEGIQIHGGYGYTEEFPMARAWRDQRLLRIGEGANEIVRLSIVSQLLRRIHAERLHVEPVLRILQQQDAFCRSVAEPEDIPDCLKQAGMLLLVFAEQHLGNRLSEEQEVMAAIADTVAGAYVAESAWIRAKKMAMQRDSSKLARLAHCAAQIYTEGIRQQAHRGIENVLARLYQMGANGRALANKLDSVMPRRTCDLITLRRELAAATLEREAYPW
jgi:alkylation response protein AidB-like acyl-CoA dehydrogenase